LRLPLRDLRPDFFDLRPPLRLRERLRERDDRRLLREAERLRRERERERLLLFRLPAFRDFRPAFRALREPERERERERLFRLPFRDLRPLWLLRCLRPFRPLRLAFELERLRDRERLLLLREAERERERERERLLRLPLRPLWDLR